GVDIEIGGDRSEVQLYAEVVVGVVEGEDDAAWVFQRQIELAAVAADAVRMGAAVRVSTNAVAEPVDGDRPEEEIDRRAVGLALPRDADLEAVREELPEDGAEVLLDEVEPRAGDADLHPVVDRELDLSGERAAAAPAAASSAASEASEE